MTITPIKLGDSGLVVAPNGAVVDTGQRGAATYPNLGSAVEAIKTALQAGDSQKRMAAKAVQAIRRQELWREAGKNSMEEFLPILLTGTEGIGWNAARTIKGWLTFADIYWDYLEMDEDATMVANSHLHALLTLAQVDRKTRELSDETKPGKLDADAFSVVSAVITALVSIPTIAQKRAGLAAPELRALLCEAGPNGKPALSQDDLDSFAALAKKAPSEWPTLPVNGWTVQDTKDFISLVRGKQDEADNEEKAQRLWLLSFEDENQVEVDRLVFILNGAEIESYASGKTYTTETFARLSGKDKRMSVEEYDAAAGDGE